jgi:protein O-GlcNAc transferase
MILERARELALGADYTQAESLLLRHLKKSPNDPDALHLMCFILAHTARMAQARFYAERAVAAAPDNPNALANLGNTLLSLGHESQALETLHRAAYLEERAGGTTATHALALALNSTQHFTRTRDVCRPALTTHAGNIPLTLDLADALQNLAQADQAVALLRPLAESTTEPLVAGNLAAAMNYAPGLSPAEIHHAHTRFAGTLAKNLPPPSPPTIADPNPDRPVRLGLIIPDLNRHSVAYFIRPVLERLDTARFVLFIYFTSPSEKVTPDWSIVKHTARRIAWDPLPKLDALVRADRLDMLMDLCGMSTQHRLQLMHLKPAPIQLTYAGYPNTTGLSAIDYRIVDSHTDPPGSQQFASERLLRLDPCFLCYTPPADAPAPSSLPSSQRGFITFGSFNHLPKLNDALIGLWCRILNSVADSRLILKAQGLLQPETRFEIQSRFAAAGLSPERLTLLPPTPTRVEHLDTYSQVDIGLDPFPYHGTTTTCEALWMGVPVITLAGNSHVSRVGVSLLRNLGLDELIASTMDQYAALAGSLALDSSRLRSLRAELRSRLTTSPLCNQPAFAARFQALLREVWTIRCRS